MKLITLIKKHRETLHSVALHAAVISLTCIVIAMYEPMTGEVLNGMMVQIGTIVNLTFAILGSVVLASLFFWNFGKGLTVRVVMDSEPVTRLLGPGTWTAPDIAPDKLICSLPGESPADFARRAEAAINEAKPEKWVVVIRFRDPVGMIYSSLTHFREFKRAEPPFVTGAVSPEDYLYSQESEQHYKQYCTWFAEHFREFSPIQKVTGDDNPGLIFRRVLAAGLFALLMMFAPGLTAQTNVEELTAVLKQGNLLTKVPKKGDEISYSFERKGYIRIGNGRDGYVKLLTNVNNFREGNVGAFESLIVNDKVIATQTRRAAVSALPLNDENDFVLPDSAGLEERLTATREKFDFYKSQFWQGVRPTWETVMYFFWGILPLLLIAGVVLWFWAKLSASEEMPDIHWRSSKALVMLIGMSWTVLIINATMTLISWEPGPVGLVVGVALIAAFAFRSASWVVPNIQAKPGGRTAFMPGNYNNRQLPG